MIFPACLEPYWPSPRGPSLDRWGGEVVRDGLAQEQGLGWGWSWLFCGSWLLYRIWSSQLLLLILDVALIHTWQITSLLGRQNHR